MNILSNRDQESLNVTLDVSRTFSQHHSLIRWEACRDRCSTEILPALAKIFFLGCPLTPESPKVTSVIARPFLCILNVCHLFRSSMQIHKMNDKTPTVL